jgi:ankyrin repeat protein
MTDSMYDTGGMGSVGSDDEVLPQDHNGSVKKVYTLLHYASSCGDEEIFRVVLDQCKNLSAILLDDRANNDTNETPLHFAVSCNNI